MLLNAIAFNSALSLLIWFLYSGSNSQQNSKNVTEGGTCSIDNINGTCVKMHICPTLVVDIMSPDKPKEYPDTCVTDGDVPVVCCTACKKDYVKNISDAVYAPSGVLYWKTGKKLWDKCLEYSKYSKPGIICPKRGGAIKLWDEEQKCHYVSEWVNRPIGGRDAKREEFTHTALVGYGPSMNEAQWLCAGTLISDRFILTAGHCIYEPTFGPIRYAALGVLKRSDPESLWQNYFIRKVIPHPEYKSPSKYHDITLLETEIAIVFSSSVFPACLTSLGGQEPELSERIFYDVTAVGWGALKHKTTRMADTLQVINIRMFDDESCKLQYPPHRHLRQGYNGTTQMCYGDMQKAVDTCQGDSGGPLQVYNPSLCMFVVIGVTSYGRACGLPGQAGMYTRVRHYLPWIESVVWPEY